MLCVVDRCGMLLLLIVVGCSSVGVVVCLFVCLFLLLVLFLLLLLLIVVD